MKWKVTTTCVVKTKREADKMIADAEKRGWKAKKAEVASKAVDFVALQKIVDGLGGATRDRFNAFVYQLHGAVMRVKGRLRIELEHTHRQPRHGRIVLSDSGRWVFSCRDAYKLLKAELKRQGVSVLAAQEKDEEYTTYERVPDGEEPSGTATTTTFSFVVVL